MDISSITEVVKETAATVDDIVKTAAGLAGLFKSGKKLDTAETHDLRDRISDLLDTALIAKTAQLRAQDLIFTLKTENEALKAKIGNMEAFEHEAQAYELRAIARNSFAYIMKAQAGTPEHTPYLCVPCFDNHLKGVLQFEQKQPGFDLLRCPRCRNIAWFPNDETLGVASAGSNDWNFSAYGE